MGRICIYYRKPPERDRWLSGDRWVRRGLRGIAGRHRRGGLDKVFANLVLGFDRLGVPYLVNPPVENLRSDDQIGVLGIGRHALEGYDRPFPVVAGVGLMTHPSEWPDLCEQYPVARYLQHSRWACDVYRRYFGDRCAIWPVGIDTRSWVPSERSAKKIDVLLYDKIQWRRDEVVPLLLEPIKAELSRIKLTFIEIRYGHYSERQYREALRHCRSMLFLCEHESQGIAYQECLAAGVPVLAWDQGSWLDPNRFAWGDPNVPATSVPYFDQRCGLRFRGIADFAARLTEFLDRRPSMSPRNYILENLTLEKCSAHYMQIFDEVLTPSRRSLAQ